MSQKVMSNPESLNYLHDYAEMRMDTRMDTFIPI